MRLFYFFGEKIYGLIKKKRGEYFIKKQSGSDMKSLYPGRNTAEKLKDYYVKKIAYTLCILTAGGIFSILASVKAYTEHAITGERYIARNDYGKGEKELDVTADYGNGIEEQVSLRIGERRYTDQELQTLYEKAKEEVLRSIFAEGERADHVRSDLHLPDLIEGFPFEIRWESGDYATVDYDGTLHNAELSEEGKVVNLCASFQYFEFKREYVFPVHILPPVLSGKEIRRQELERSMAENEAKSIYEKEYKLPEQIGGKSVQWKEKKENNAGIILIIASTAAALIYCVKDYDLHKQVLAKQEEMFECYPEVINRLVLYVGAGMTVRNAWRKIAREQTKQKGSGGKKGYIYQEMLFTCYEIDSGTSEQEAYERFGRRCGIQQYIKLATLLVQNMQKGNSTMLQQLKEEAEIAFAQRMDRARKKGEEAGTKLLMPMMILFGMVLILIMIPAFGTFGG